MVVVGASPSQDQYWEQCSQASLANYQFQRLRSCIAAGTSTNRTSVASRRRLQARNSNCCTSVRRGESRESIYEIMMAAAWECDNLAVCVVARQSIAIFIITGAIHFLLHPSKKEYFV